MQRKPMIFRPTAMALALAAAAQRLGYDTTNVRMPQKREPAWTVTRRSK